MIICRKCGEEKDESLFPKDQSRPTGYHPYCRTCKSQEQRDRERAKMEAKYQDDESNFRVCDDCGERKIRSDFNKLTFSRTNCKVKCLACQAKFKEEKPLKSRFTRRRDEIKLHYIEELGGCCKRCGLVPSEMFPVACFDFHHTGESEKAFNIAHHIHRFSTQPEILEKEISKCVILCSNCHRAIHST